MGEKRDRDFLEKNLRHETMVKLTVVYDLRSLNFKQRGLQ